MNKSKARACEATFVVRLWADDGPKRESSWRGKVQHVQSGKEEYFHRFDKLGEIIRQFTLELQKQ